MSKLRKISICIVLFFCLNSFIKAQQGILEKKIDISLGKYTEALLLKKISKKTKYYFTYNTDIVDSKIFKKYEFHQLSVKQILDSVFKDTLLVYKVIDNHIVLYQKGKEIKFASSKPKNNFVKGYLVDNLNNKKIAFANIGILGKPVGTISNMDGFFSMKIAPNQLNDTIVISYIGYKTYKASIQNLINETQVLTLEPHIVSLQEIIVRNTEPQKIVRSALENLREKYFDKSYMLTAFYRENIKTRKHSLIYSEAILEIYKKPFFTVNNDDIKLIKGRKNINLAKIDTAIIKLKGGENSVTDLDLIKFPIEFINVKGIDYYNYSIVDIVLINNKPTYKIEFYSKDSRYIYEGVMYIDLKKLILIEVDYSINKKIIRKKARLFIAKRSRGIKLKPISAKYKVSYKEINGKYFLNHIKGDLGFKLRIKKKFWSKNFDISFELASSKVDTINLKKIKRKDKLKKSEIFSDRFFGYDKNFWGENNIIVPEESLNKALLRIKSCLQKIDENE